MLPISGLCPWPCIAECVQLIATRAGRPAARTLCFHHSIISRLSGQALTRGVFPIRLPSCPLGKNVTELLHLVWKLRTYRLICAQTRIRAGYRGHVQQGAFASPKQTLERERERETECSSLKFWSLELRKLQLRHEIRGLLAFQPSQARFWVNHRNPSHIRLRSHVWPGRFGFMAFV